MSKTILYLNADADAVNAEMLMPRFPRGPLHVDQLKFSRVEVSSRAETILGYMDTSTRVENKNISAPAELKNAVCIMFIRHDI